MEKPSGNRSGSQFSSEKYAGRNTLIKRCLIWTAILTVLLWLYPIEYRITRFAFAIGIFLLWAGSLFFWWKIMSLRISLLFLGGCFFLAACLPGRTVDANELAADYCRSLRSYEGVRYVWGGEGFIGIDCSGLVRRGMIKAKLVHGLETCNGRLIREAMELWWHDSSAEAMGQGYRQWTTELFRSASISDTDHSRLRPGDMAVTADGVHILAYLGNNTWIEADPDAHSVIQVVLPTENRWFHSPVVFVRWSSLNRAQRFEPQE